MWHTPDGIPEWIGLSERIGDRFIEIGAQIYGLQAQRNWSRAFSDYGHDLARPWRQKGATAERKVA